LTPVTSAEKIVKKIGLRFFRFRSGCFSDNPELQPFLEKILVPVLVPVRGQKTGKKGHERSLSIFK
jgi:hypothetical protein